ncbi:MAG: acetyl-CoA carboxylase biotin carboxyl carrier protein [Planctomycetota bacterium]|jgi:acetyl-CoA carboxylase biotin carboxyl carrier protein
MIDIRKLKELVRLMVNNELTELDLRDSEEQVTLRRQPPGAVGAVPTMMMPAAPAAAAPAAPPAAAPAAPAAADAPADDAGLARIESPIVGTFYSAANPDAAPFVSVGSRVSADTTVCIIEAMKIFNEIKAETSGVIERVLVGNGDAVEFGQPMFLVRPE